MASFTAGTTFVDGVANDVTAAKLSALVNNATPTSGLIQDRTAETVVATNDTFLIGDASDSNTLKRMTVANVMKAELTGTINTTAGTIATLNSTTGTITGLNSTTGTVATLNSTTGTITTGVIPTLTSITKITSGTGTAAAPAISPTGDTNTGIFFPAADTVAFAEGGTEAMRIDSSGNVGIGTTSPAAKLNVYDASSATFSLQGDSTTQALVQRASADSSSPAVALRKSRGSIASPAAVITGDFIGNIEFQAYGGTNNRILSRVLGQAETYVSDTNISSNLIFQTSNVGAATPTEKMRIDSSGNVSIGTATALSKLHVHGDLTMSNATTGTTASTSTITPPATVAGYLTVSINGTSRKIAYYAT